MKEQERDPFAGSFPGLLARPGEWKPKQVDILEQARRIINTEIAKQKALYGPDVAPMVGVSMPWGLRIQRRQGNF